ncbi:MAG: hypothetical protein AAF611_03990 [Bacteroidota bacterium]
MKKQRIKNLSLNKISISNLEQNRGGSASGQNSVRFCIRTIIDQNGNNPCLSNFRTCTVTAGKGCVLTVEVDANTLPIC